MTTQKDLAERFALGDDTGTASNVSIASYDDGSTELIGYGWAAYATRTPSGRITLHEGWRGYSMSTTCQLTELRKGFRAAGVDFETASEGRPERGVTQRTTRETAEVPA